MKKCTLVWVCWHIWFGAFGQAAHSVVEYIAAYKDLAIGEMLYSKVPASITLAQGILETGAGSSDLATEANNHFGIKCHKGWDGMTFAHQDDEYNAKGELVNSCFRKYARVEESYRDHSNFLMYRPYYASLFDLSPTDYQAWAKGLKAAGYATAPHYAKKLIQVIETYELWRFDLEGREIENQNVLLAYHQPDASAVTSDTYFYEQVSTKVGLYPSETQGVATTTQAAVKKQTDFVPKQTVVVGSSEDLSDFSAFKEVEEHEGGTFTSKPTKKGLDKVDAGKSTAKNSVVQNMPDFSMFLFVDRSAEGIFKVNGVKAVCVGSSQDITDVALQYNMVEEELLAYNEMSSNQRLYPKQYVYLQPKKKQYQGKEKAHLVRGGDNMYVVSQLYGIQKKTLMRRNKLHNNQEPLVGEVIYLHDKARHKPKIREAGTAQPPTIAKPMVYTPSTMVLHTPVVSDRTTLPNSGSEIVRHIVGKSDTLQSIAQQYKVDTKELLTKNRLVSHVLREGQVLIIR